LIKVVDVCRKANIAITTVHDCFGVHPNNVEILRSLIKSEFIQMYFGPTDWLINFHNHNLSLIKTNVVGDRIIISKSVSLPIPKLPQFSSLTPEDVLNSNYMVC